METKDFIVTPIIILLVYMVAFILRPRFTNSKTHGYFIPALTVKIVGALAVGFIYQFYYGGGDTFTYFNLGSVHIWNAFVDSPWLGIKLIFGSEGFDSETYKYYSNIYTYGDSASYFVVRVAGFLGLVCFSTYSSIAVLFAVIGFCGLWALYSSVLYLYPALQRSLAIAILFVPSVLFWGSGLLKDTLTLSAVGLLFYGLVQLILKKEWSISSLVIIVLSIFVLYQIKIYILLSFLPGIMLWLYKTYIKRIGNPIIRLMSGPILLGIAISFSYYLVVFIGSTNNRYSLDKFIYTAESTAKWNYFVSQRDEGSGYTLGDFDFSPAGIIRKAPAAVWLGMFRPYLWESNNVVMLMAGLENLIFLILFLYAIWCVIKGGLLSQLWGDPFLMMSLLFVILFSFSIGLTTYNFGSLVRYKIPMLPFLASFLVIVIHYSKRARKLA